MTMGEALELVRLKDASNLQLIVEINVEKVGAHSMLSIWEA